jgi:hypothetical protein
VCLRKVSWMVSRVRARSTCSCSLRSCGSRTALSERIAGAVFGLVHIMSYLLDTLPVKAAFGVIACCSTSRRVSLLPGIGLHVFVDASVVDWRSRAAT